MKIETYLKGLLFGVSVIRLALILSVVGLVHYWVFVLNIGQRHGHFAHLVDLTHFLQFQSLFVAHIVLATLFTESIRLTGWFLADFIFETFGKKKLSTLLLALFTPRVSAALWLAIFSFLYTGFDAILFVFPFLANFPQDAWMVIPWFALLIYVVLDRKRRKRAPCLSRAPAEALGEDSAAHVTGLIFFGVGISAMVAAYVIGSARAESQKRVGFTAVELSSRAIELRVIGITAYGIVGIERECDCFYIVPFGSIKTVQTAPPSSAR